MDLYKAMLRKERTYLSVVDGVVAGEGQGPFCPTSKNANTLIVGDNLLAVDFVAARYMGLDPQKIRYLSYFLENKEYDMTYRDIEVSCDGKKADDFFMAKSRYKDFHVVSQWECIKNNAR